MFLEEPKVARAVIGWTETTIRQMLCSVPNIFFLKYVSPDDKLLPPSMDTRDTIGIISALPAFKGRW